MDGGDLLVEVMTSLGVECAFGVVSVHNLPLVDAVDRRLRFIPVRHEAAAVSAADGYGRARGSIGVAVTSTGTGAGNAAGSLIEAQTAGTAVLHLTGQIPSEHLGRERGVIHETRDQIGMLRAVSKLALTLTASECAGSLLRSAAATALAAPAGPVSVEWPIDLQYREQVDGVAEPQPASPFPDAADIEEAARLIAEARRPLLWLGGGAHKAAPQVARLVARTGAGILTSNAGRGVVPEDNHRCVGNFASSPGCERLLAEADLLVAVGTHFRSNETRDFTLPLPRPHILVDVRPAAFGRAYACDVGLVGDAAAVIDALVTALPDESDAEEGWATRVATTRLTVRRDLREGIGQQALICDAIRTSLPRHSVVARDVTIPSSSWGNRLLDMYDPLANVYARGGGIGQGLAMGIGAAVARPQEPVALIVGDGGLAVHLGELLTLAQERPWLTVVLFDDGGYGVLRNMQDRHVGRRSGVDLVTPHFGGLCRSMHLFHERVTDAGAFGPVFERALAERGPAVIEVDVDAIGEMPVPFVPPVRIPGQEPS